MHVKILFAASANGDYTAEGFQHREPNTNCRQFWRRRKLKKFQGSLMFQHTGINNDPAILLRSCASKSPYGKASV